MDRTEAIARLKTRADAIRAMGAVSLYLYGSTVRGAATSNSDLDLFIEYDPGGRFNALDLVGIKQWLEERLGTPVDLATRDGLHPRLREAIEASAVRVF